MAGLPVSWIRNGMACGKEMLLQAYFVEQQKQTCVLVKMGISENNGTPKSSINRLFHYIQSILGYLYFWKHPNGEATGKAETDAPMFLARPLGYSA